MLKTLGLSAAAALVALSLAFHASAQSTPPPKVPAGTPVPAKLDINGATKASLARLASIGDENAQKIIDGRPYTTTAELETRKILPKEVYDKIATLIVVRQKPK